MLESAKAKFNIWHTTLLDATNNVIELRRQEMSKVALDELPKPNFCSKQVEKTPFVSKFHAFDMLDKGSTHDGDATKKAKLEAAIQNLADVDGGSHQGAVDYWEENKSTLSCS